MLSASMSLPRHSLTSLANCVEQLLALSGKLSRLHTLTLSMPVEGRRLSFLQAISRIATFFKFLSSIGTVPLQELRVECYGSSFSALANILEQEGTLDACKQLEEVLLAFPRHALKFCLAGNGRHSTSFRKDMRNTVLRDRFPRLWVRERVEVELPLSKHFLCPAARR